jgi:hypothetical protein
VVEKFGKKLEMLANVAIVLVAFAIVGVLGYKYFWSNPDAPKDLAEVKIGENLNFPNVNWNEKKQTVVLVLAKGCHFCSESTPFYQKILQKVSTSNQTKLVVAFPHSLETGKHYLKENGLSINEILQVNFSAAKIRGTPTIFLVDEKGVIKNMWLGMLRSKEEEDELLKNLL